MQNKIASHCTSLQVSHRLDRVASRRRAFPRYQKKLQVAGRRRRTFKFIDCPAGLITASLKTYPLTNLALPDTIAALLFILSLRAYLFFIAGYYCPLNFKCSAANFRCLRDLRGAVSKCFIEHKCKFATRSKVLLLGSLSPLQ